MRGIYRIAGLAALLAAGSAHAGDAEIRAAQQSIDAQLRAFQAGDEGLAYSYAAPNIKRIFPTLQSFMGMVAKGYEPVAHPKSYSFGKSTEPAPGSIAQQVLIVGPDGKDYEAVYTLELQPDGKFRITGVSLRTSKTLST